VAVQLTREKAVVAQRTECASRGQFGRIDEPLLSEERAGFETSRGCVGDRMRQWRRISSWPERVALEPAVVALERQREVEIANRRLAPSRFVEQAGRPH